MSSIANKYGNPTGADGAVNAQWKAKNIISVTLPYPMRLSWATSITVNSLQFHKQASGNLVSALTLVWRYARIQVKREVGYDKSTAEYDALTLNWLRMKGLDITGGTWNYRPVRGGTTLSMHAYGLAIDINPNSYPLNSHKRLPDWFIEAFTKNGFAYGGDWQKTPDPMHFEIAH